MWFVFVFVFVNYNDVFDIFRLNNMEEVVVFNGNSLFVLEILDDFVIERMIDYLRDILYWVVVEIVSCSLFKVIEIFVF